MSNPKSKIENPKSYSQSVRRWFLPVKNNLAPDVATYGRAFEIVDGQIRWHGDDPAPSLAEALLPSAHNTDRRRLRHAAAAFIREALDAGPLPSKELYQQGIDNGFSKGTLKRAATELGIHPHKTGFNGGWEMRWVEQPVVRGRGSPARAAGWGFKVIGGQPQEASGVRRQESGPGGGDATATNEGVSFASSLECDESAVASCASSLDREESSLASCASSLECEESEIASCAPSVEREESCAASCPPSNNEADVAAPAVPIRQPLTPHATAPPSIAPPTDHQVNMYSVIMDALRETCLPEAG